MIAPQPPDRDYRTVIACRTPAQPVHSPALVAPSATCAPTRRPTSWYGLTGAGFRFDHVFVSTPHMSHVAACDYHQQAREAGLTDHAVMTLRLGLPVTPST
ncbi:hypothetical protein [Streptomyces nogalater]|uniref:Uncharacterized protein n=1 Tax=Streptomyces nogalater TaxID=38314 RepID=A0ABW0WJK3_STRNO